MIPASHSPHAALRYDSRVSGARTEIAAVRWRDGLELLDQRRLPAEERWLAVPGVTAAVGLIRNLAVRGAPAIGLVAAYALAAEARANSDLARLRRLARRLAAARPTATNLARAVAGVMAAVAAGPAARPAPPPPGPAGGGGGPPAARPPAPPRARAAAGGGAGGAAAPEAGRAAAALAEARAQHAADAAACLAMGEHGAALIPGERVAVLTHCNAGALATGGIGTALGVVRVLHAEGRLVRLYACEARPVLQGARLTAWEAVRDGIPVTLLPDSAAASLLASGAVAAVVVGADRIAADGAVANKVGTYPLAVLAARHGVPFVVAAPVTTFDLSCPNGSSIPIEQRAADEVRRVRGRAVAPATVDVYNPAFDVTPPELVWAIVSERGAARPVTLESIRKVAL